MRLKYVLICVISNGILVLNFDSIWFDILNKILQFLIVVVVVVVVVGSR